MVGKKRNQHLIPQLWLKHFSVNNGVYVYDTKSQKSIGYRNIKSIGYRPYFYDFSKESLEFLGNDFIGNFGSQYVEDSFLANKIEDNLAKVLPKILQKPWKLLNKNWVTEEEKEILSIHFSIQFFRTEVFRTLIEHVLKIINEYGNNNNYEDLKEDFSGFESLFHFKYMSDEDKVVNLSKAFYNKAWTVFYNETETPFFTSDNPIVLQYSKSYVNICIPISSEILIVLYDEKFNSLDQYVLHPSLDQVREFNLLQIQQCGRQVFSPTNNFEWIKKQQLSKTGFHVLLNSNDSWIHSYTKQVIEKREE